MSGPMIWTNLIYFRTDVRAYDLDELYEFADKTGILERHKQLLAKPYHDSQVAMRVCDLRQCARTKSVS